MKQINFIDFNDYFDPEKIINVSEGFKKNEFNDKGIYSERIFGNYYAENNDITDRGWIVLNHSLINPLLYLIMKNKKVLLKDDEKNLMNIIEQIKEDHVKFLESRRTTKNSDTIDFLIKNYKYLLIDKYPVFSHKLRPITVLPGAKPTLVYDKVNNHFSLLIEYNNTIKDSLTDKNFDNNEFIFGMQDLINTITDFLMSSVLSKKKGILRKEVLGNRVNNSSRMVITPLVGKEIDEIEMPYIVAVELYKYQILNILTRIKGINYNQALKIHEKAQLKFNKEIYNILCSLVEKTKGGLTVLLNRAPRTNK